MSERTPNAAARLEHTLTLEILRGQHPPGVRLPPVRALAARFGVNPATVQRALARLEANGLAEARHGSGVLVKDPLLHGHVSLVPVWLTALSDRPEEAAAVLTDFLEVRRILAARLLVRHRDRLMESRAVADAAARFAEAAEDGNLMDADLEFVRVLLREVGNRVALSVFNTAARVVTEVPAVAEAMYADPERNAAAMTRVLRAMVGHSGGALAHEVESILEEVDHGTVRRYRATLEASHATA